MDLCCLFKSTPVLPAVVPARPGPLLDAGGAVVGSFLATIHGKMSKRMKDVWEWTDQFE